MDQPDVKLFESGKDFDDWCHANCDRCSKYSNENISKCSVASAIWDAMAELDKIVSPRVAEVLGWQPGIGTPKECRALDPLKKARRLPRKNMLILGPNESYRPWGCSVKKNSEH